MHTVTITYLLTFQCSPVMRTRLSRMAGELQIYERNFNKQVEHKLDQYKVLTPNLTPLHGEYKVEKYQKNDKKSDKTTKKS